MAEPHRRDTMLPAPWALPAALAWLLVSGSSIAVVTMGFVNGFRDPSSLRTPQVEDVFAILGIPLRLGIGVALLLPFVVFVAAAAMIFWRRPRDGMALLFSATLLAFQVMISVVTISVLDGGGVWRAVALVDMHLAGVGLVAVLFLFPSGRPYPSWGRLVGPVLAVGLVVSDAVPSMTVLIRPVPPGAELPMLGPGMAGFAIALGVLAQLLRYRRDADPEERLQMRWVTLPFGVGFAYLFGALIVPSAFGPIDPRWLGWVMVSAIPLGIAFPIAVTVAVLRHRLYDLDLVVSRTLVYAGLAAFITATYLGVVVGLGSALGAGERTSVLLAVLVTAATAAAFHPARTRLTRAANRVVFGQRATPLEVIGELSRHLAVSATADDTLQHLVELLVEGTRASYAEVRLGGGPTARVVARSGELGNDGDEHVAEVREDGELLGSLFIATSRGTSLAPQDRHLVGTLASQAGLVLRNARLVGELEASIERLRASRQRLVRAGDEERRRLERDLHDGAQQLFVAARIKAQLARTLSDRGDDRAGPMLDELVAGLDEGIQALRDLAHGIYPPLLEAEGLGPALAARARRSPVPTTVSTDGVDRYAPEVEAAVYFCVLEALQNTAKYADASGARVQLADGHGSLTFEVSDDGVGFDATGAIRGRGVDNMTDRIDALGGSLVIRSEPGAGTTVHGTVPTSAVDRTGPQVRHADGLRLIEDEPARSSGRER